MKINVDAVLQIMERMGALLLQRTRLVATSSVVVFGGNPKKVGLDTAKFLLYRESDE
ncbi:hypothetical protein QMN21_30785 [Serratia sp. Se-PFBMAAmG]|nr:hypothetical protein [Serratia sp. Se-PFBMAAmG]